MDWSGTIFNGLYSVFIVLISDGYFGFDVIFTHQNIIAVNTSFF